MAIYYCSVLSSPLPHTGAMLPHTSTMLPDVKCCLSESLVRSCACHTRAVHFREYVAIYYCSVLSSPLRLHVGLLVSSTGFGFGGRLLLRGLGRHCERSSAKAAGGLTKISHLGRSL